MKCIVEYLTVHTSDAYSTKWVEQVHICALEVHLKCSTWELSFGKYHACMCVGDISQEHKYTKAYRETSSENRVKAVVYLTGEKTLLDSGPCGSR